MAEQFCAIKLDLHISSMENLTIFHSAQRHRHTAATETHKETLRFCLHRHQALPSYIIITVVLQSLPLPGSLAFNKN